MVYKGRALLLMTLCLLSVSSARGTVTVSQYGAKGNGNTDDAKAFLEAWNAVCAQGGKAAMEVPKGTYLLSPVEFKGPCKSTPITVQLDGTLIAPPGGMGDHWVRFWGVSGVTVQGSGGLDGQGPTWWKTKNWKQTGTIGLSFYHSTEVAIIGIKSVNSKQIHFAFYGCTKAKASGLTIIAPAQSPNTDGIHVQESSQVSITNSNIGTGDDCVSVGAGTTDLAIGPQVVCGPGHGFSIGSLGREAGGVEGVNVNGVTLQGSEFGVRIKTIPGGQGFARNITFQNVKMNKVKYPIVINGGYCAKTSCSGSGAGGTGVEVSNIRYIGITGTTWTRTGIIMQCDSAAPCKQVILQNINLTPIPNPIDFGPPMPNPLSICSNAKVSLVGPVIPKPTCT